MNDKIILLADDDCDDRFFIREAIKSSGIPVKMIEAENGLELVELLRLIEYPVSLILIDMNMPKMNGLEAMVEMKLMPFLSLVPIVMISTSPNQDLAEKAYGAGVASFMSKPNTFNEFSDLMMSLYKRFLY